MHEFHCPHCSTLLRLRDTSLRGRVIECPDCHEPVRIEETLQGIQGVSARPALGEAAPPTVPAGFDPLLYVILLAIGCLLGVLIFIWSRSGDRPNKQVHPVPAAAPADSPIALPPAMPQPNPVDNSATGNHSSPVEQRLQEIAALLQPEVDRQQAFPPGSVWNSDGEPTFSWIGSLAQTGLPRAAWDPAQSWNSAANSDYVRRRFPQFNNSLVTPQVGDDGYPASHFVGVAGLGPDAARLARSDRRAGIFGERQSARVDEVTDGLANTLLILGIHSEPGSWARPGKAAVRGLTAEPYVNGPDGFGTGQPDGMFVLMADGSTRFLSKETDPVLLRRMAAIADGLPLDPQVAGDPAETSPVPPPAPSPAMPDLPQVLNLPDLLTPSPNDIKLDWDRRMALKIQLFEQSQPTPLEDILFDVQELIGAPLDLSAVPEETRRQLVNLKLEQVTLRQVLEQLAEAGGLSVTFEPFQIVLRPR